MGGRKHRDYTQLKAEFVIGDLSMREMAAQNDVSPAALARKFREIDPASGLNTYQTRDQFRAAASGKAFDIMADHGAVQLAARNMKMLDIADTYFRLVEQKMADGSISVNMREFVLMANLVRTIIGEPTVRKEERHLGLSFTGPLTPELTAELERAARLRLIDGGTDARVVESVVEATGSD